MIPFYIWEFVKRWEGGDTLTNDPNDTGGKTRWGISQVNNPDVDVERLTELGAEELYYDRYWVPSWCEELPEMMRLVQFNCSVNCGTSMARKTLQRTVGVKPDGRIGPATRRAIQRFENRPAVFVGKYLMNQSMHYFNIVQRRKSQHKWLKGWMRRTFDACWQTAVKHGRG